MSRSVRTLLLTGLIAVSCWPWLGGLDLWPMAPDSGIWIARSRFSQPDWAEWVFATRQFGVGWRPLTGLSFTLNQLVFDLRPFGYRATDMALHAAAVAMVYAAFRAVRSGRPPWAALVAAAVFALHPAADEVVPYLARRSYPLSTALGLGGLVAFLRGARLGSGFLIAAAFLANETAVLYAAVLPFVAPPGPRPRRPMDAARPLALAAAPLALALGLRFLAIGGLGGYRLPANAADRALPVFEATWRGLAGVPEGRWLALALLVVAVPYYVWSAARARGLRLALLLWLVVYALLYASQGVWFPRQAYVAVVPLAFLVADVLAQTLADRRGPALAAHLAPQLFLIGAVLWSSPALRGPDPQRARERRARDAMITRMAGDLSACEEPATVWLVLPYERREPRPGALRAAAAGRPLPRIARQPGQWLATLLEERDIELEELAFFEGDLPRVTAEGIQMAEGTAYFAREGERLRPFGPEAKRVIPAPRTSPGRRAYVYVGDRSEGVLIPAER